MWLCQKPLADSPTSLILLERNYQSAGGRPKRHGRDLTTIIKSIGQLCKKLQGIKRMGE
jgi:hypothetical protein